MTYSFTYLCYLLSRRGFRISNPQIGIEEGEKWKSQAAEAMGVTQEGSDEGLGKGAASQRKERKKCGVVAQAGREESSRIKPMGEGY